MTPENKQKIKALLELSKGKCIQNCYICPLRSVVKPYCLSLIRHQNQFNLPNLVTKKQYIGI